jgi:hypothetical protein
MMAIGVLRDGRLRIDARHHGRSSSNWYPREQYLMNLAALHGQLGDQDRQLAVVESLLDDGRLNAAESNLRMIVNLFMGEELPLQGGHGDPAAGNRKRTSWKRDRNNLELLSQAWMLSAREPLRTRWIPWNAAAELVRKRRTLSAPGPTAHGRLPAGTKPTTRHALALEEGRSAPKEGHAWLLRGMAEVRLKRFTDARRRFEKAAGFKETEKYAGQWLTYLESEAQRAEALSNS